MSYTPNNVNNFSTVYSAMFAACLAAYRANTSQDSSHPAYTDAAVIAGAFAEEFDTIWGAEPFSVLENELAESLVYGYFESRSVRNVAPFNTAAQWESVVNVVIAQIEASLNYFNGQGINPDTGAQRKAYFQKQNALLEPSLTEKPLFGDFTYSPASSRWIIASFATSLEPTGRMEVRTPQFPLWLKDADLVGLQSLMENSPSYAIPLNPNGVIYDDPEADYYRRLSLLAEQKVQFIPLPDPQTQYPFFPGPYGTIITNVTSFNYGAGVFGGNFAQGAINWSTELFDDPTGAIRYDQAMTLMLAKGTIGWMETQVSRGGGLDGNAGVAYVLLPREWSTIDTLSSTYIFRDDFMGAALDPDVWTVTETTPGNIEIFTPLAAVQGIGADAWTNGMYSTASYDRSSGYSYVADGWVPPSLQGGPAVAGNVVFGLSDGQGVDFSNFLHGLSINNTGTAVIENGVYTSIDSLEVGTLYRLRVTPGIVNGALYEIQGGRNWPMIGADTWHTVADTRGGGSSAASFKIGYSAYASGKHSYLSDVRVYLQS